MSLILKYQILFLLHLLLWSFYESQSIGIVEGKTESGGKGFGPGLRVKRYTTRLKLVIRIKIDCTHSASSLWFTETEFTDSLLNLPLPGVHVYFSECVRRVDINDLPTKTTSDLYDCYLSVHFWSSQLWWLEIQGDSSVLPYYKKWYTDDN